MGLTDEDVVKIVHLLAESTFDELRLEMGDLKLVVSKGTGKGVDRQVEAPSGLGPLPDYPQQPAVAKAVSVVSSLQKESEPSEAARTDLVAIKSPSVGTFYRAPKSGAPPFVDVGASVNEDDTVQQSSGIITAPKPVFQGVGVPAMLRPLFREASYSCNMKKGNL